MRKYPKYKDSGVELIGEIPDRWEFSRLGFSIDTLVPMRDKPEDLTGDIPWIRIEDVDNKYISESKTNKGVTEETVRKMNLKVYPINTVLCTCSCSFGTTVIVKKPLTSNQTFIGLVPKENRIYSEFLYFLLQVWKNELEFQSSGSIQLYLSRDNFKSLKVVLPSLKEQHQIVEFLDQKTSIIDELIEKKQRKVELLKEHRTSIINHTVTKGLNPKVKMKDSGLEWIGEIPEHWEKKKITYCFQKIGSGTTPTSGQPEYYENGDYNWLQTGDLNDGEIYETSKKITGTALKDFTTLRFYPIDSIVIAMYGATIGKLGILKIESTTNQACCVLSNPQEVDVRFIFYWFISNKKDIISLSYGGGQPNINQDIIRNLRLQIPTMDEQHQIVQFLDQKTQEIDTTITLENKKIDLLKEYRQSLISEVVTGKIDVRKN